MSKFDFKMTSKEKNQFRKSLGLKQNDFVMIYAAELLPRQRQTWLIETLNETLKNNPHFHLLLPGKDSMDGKCQRLVKSLYLCNQIHFLGFRKDIPKLLKISDLALSSSNQEGLPVNIMEDMYCGLPVIATNCRGNRDLIENGKNGYVVDIGDKKNFVDKVLKISKFIDQQHQKIKKENEKKIEPCLLENVLSQIIKYMNR